MNCMKVGNSLLVSFVQLAREGIVTMLGVGSIHKFIVRWSEDNEGFNIG